MTLPELDVARVQRWCRARVPERVRDQVRVEVDVAPQHLTIVECRPPWRADFGPEWTRHPVARFRYTRTTRQWSLYWRDRNLRFHEYDLVQPADRLEDLLMEVDLDPTAIFAADALTIGLTDAAAAGDRDVPVYGARTAEIRVRAGPSP